jgi:hypothetical protein
MRRRAWWLLLAAAWLVAGCETVVVTAMEFEGYSNRDPGWFGPYWGWPVPIVNPGSPVFYVERAWASTKGMVVVTHRTVFTRYDLATCRQTGERKFRGSVKVYGWGALPGEVWLRAESDKDLVHGFDGATRPASELAPPPIGLGDPTYLSRIRDAQRGPVSPSGRFSIRTDEPNELTVVERSGRVAARQRFDLDVNPGRWSEDEAHLFVQHYDSPGSRWWSMGVATGQVVEIPPEALSSSPRFVEIGDILFYVDGPPEAPHLAAVNLSTGQRWAVTQPLQRIDTLIAEPQAKKLILTVGSAHVLTYDLAKATLTLCK